MLPFRTVLFFSYSRVIDPVLRSIRTSSAEFAGMGAGDLVLDICCGTGDQAMHYAGRGIMADGIDLDPRMITAARRRNHRLALENVSFQMADAERLPFRDRTFDHASVSMGLHEKGRPAGDRLVAEMRRVVKDGGCLLFIDYRVPLPRNMVSLMVRAVERAAGGEHHRCFRDYIDRGGLDEILKTNGLRAEKRALFLKGAITMVKAGNLQSNGSHSSMTNRPSL